MTLDQWLKSGIEYGCDLVRAALQGARSAESEMLEGRPRRDLLMHSARTSLVPAATAASLGIVAGYLATRRKSAATAVGFGVLGATIGFAGGIAWSTRHMTEEVTRGAIKGMSATRDARWLARHPVDYA
jgi:hypothetical protein